MSIHLYRQLGQQVLSHSSKMGNVSLGQTSNYVLTTTKTGGRVQHFSNKGPIEESNSAVREKLNYFQETTLEKISLLDKRIANLEADKSMAGRVDLLEKNVVQNNKINWGVGLSSMCLSALLLTKFIDVNKEASGSVEKDNKKI